MSLLARISEHFDRLRPTTLRAPKEGDFIKHPYGVPAGFYDQLWDWDGFFINTHLANRPDDPKPEYFRYWVLNFLSAYREVGYPPGCVTTEQPETERRDFSLKPFMAQSALLGSSEGFEWLREEYKDIVEIVTRREETNFDEATGLFFWDDAMQSGADNNAADSNVPELKSLFLSCDMNAFQWKEYTALTTIAQELGHTSDSDKFQSMADSLRGAIQEHLWNDELNTLDNKRRDTGSFVQCISYSNFVPLWAGLPDEEQAALMIESYLLQEDHLFTPWGARSLSKQDRAYNNANIIIPYSNWCGPIWPIANYFYHVGLKNYGYHAEAQDLAERVAKLLLTDLDNLGSMHESYCAETGATLAPSADQAPRFIEGGFIGWNLLVQDMLEAGEK
ncbi:MAG: MGH1-like glycoside hydrolase domain-containing protein [Akkermansiaceae bacterium]